MGVQQGAGGPENLTIKFKWPNDSEAKQNYHDFFYYKMSFSHANKRNRTTSRLCMRHSKSENLNINHETIDHL